MTPPVRLLLVDDNHDFLVSASAHLRTRPQLSIVGAVRSGEEAFTLLNSAPVDLVLLDLNVCGLDGLETTRQFKAGPRAPKVIIVTLQDAPEYRRRALAAGADGFIGKAEFTTALFPLIATLFPAEAP
ncbi:MAG: response regulator transcription factor [Undibacterium sp.]|nr:response regulator transcription factor [Opitutaceae bacterium]